MNEQICQTCGDPFEDTLDGGSTGKYDMCEDCLNLYIHEKLDAITSRPHQHGEDVSLWVTACNTLLANAGFDPDFMWCSTCRKPRPHFVEIIDDIVCESMCLNCRTEITKQEDKHEDVARAT